MPGDKMSSDNKASDNSLFELVPIEHKGLGLRATEHITKGTRIMADKALILFEMVEEEASLADYIGIIGPKLAKLKKKDYDIFMALCNIYPNMGKLEHTQAGIARTSSIMLSLNPEKHGIFPNVARINHSCVPNAFYSWNEAIGRLTVHAVKDIKKGEEITIHYHIAVEVSADRQKRHASVFNFNCKCSACTAPLPTLRLRDNLLLVLRKHLDVFDSGKIDELKKDSSKFALRHSRELIEIAKHAGMANTITSDALREAAMVSIFNSDQARAMVFAKRAYEARLILEGADSVRVKNLAKFAKNPANHPDFGITDAWKSKPQDIPTDLSEEDFEGWLWQVDPKALIWDRAVIKPNLGDFTDNDLFPMFDKLPKVNHFDPEFWRFDPKRQELVAARFWCLLGEIVSVDLTNSLQLVVKDKAGTTFPVAFQTGKLGLELNISLLQKGNVIAMIGAERRVIQGTKVEGVTQRREGHVNVFNMSLDRLMELSNVVKGYSIEDDEGKNKCLGCDKESKELNAHCSKCKMMFFCDRECQIRAWKDKGHKKDCSLLASKEVAGLLCCQWEVFE